MAEEGTPPNSDAPFSSSESDYESDISEESILDGMIQSSFPYLGQSDSGQFVNSQPPPPTGQVSVNFPRDISRGVILPYNYKQCTKIISVHNRAVKAFDTLLVRIKRALELTRLTIDDCIKDLKLLDLDKHPDCCKIRTRFISIMREAFLQAQTRGTFFEEISIFIESEIKRVVNEYFPQNVEDFVYANMRRIMSKKPMWFPLEPMHCLLCVDKLADCRIIPGEASNCCTCKEMAVCVECMLRHYWENSESNRKSYAVCPQCRGEFTLSSLIYVNYELNSPSSQRTPQILQSSQQELIIPKSVTISKRSQHRNQRSSNTIIRTPPSQSHLPSSQEGKNKN